MLCIYYDVCEIQNFLPIFRKENKATMYFKTGSKICKTPIILSFINLFMFVANIYVPAVSDKLCIISTQNSLTFIT